MVPGQGGIILEEPFILGDDELHHLGQGTAHHHVHGVMHSLTFPDLQQRNIEQKIFRINILLTTLGVMTIARLLADILFLSSCLLTSCRN